jgi:hypothetical protein
LAIQNVSFSYITLYSDFAKLSTDSTLDQSKIQQNVIEKFGLELGIVAKRPVDSLETPELKNQLRALSDANLKLNSAFDSALHLVLSQDALFKLARIPFLLKLPKTKQEEKEETENELRQETLNAALFVTETEYKKGAEYIKGQIAIVEKGNWLYFTPDTLDQKDLFLPIEESYKESKNVRIDQKLTLVLSNQGQKERMKFNTPAQAQEMQEYITRCANK